MNENETVGMQNENESAASPSIETAEVKPESGGDPTEPSEDAKGAENASAESEKGSGDADEAIYEKQAEDDLAELKRLAPEAAGYRHLGEMPGALRFAELRGLGLSVEEAYYAVCGKNTGKPSLDRGGRAHLHGSVPGRAASGGVGMSVGEIEAARRLFPGLSDREITSLFRRVNENRNQ